MVLETESDDLPAVRLHDRHIDEVIAVYQSLGQWPRRGDVGIPERYRLRTIRIGIVGGRVLAGVRKTHARVGAALDERRARHATDMHSVRAIVDDDIRGCCAEFDQ